MRFKGMFVAVFVAVAMQAAIAKTPVYRCDSDAGVAYGSERCEGARTVERPALEANAADSARAEKRSNAEIARADRAVANARRLTEAESNRRHASAIVDKRIEAARVRREEIAASKEMRARSRTRRARIIRSD